MNTKINNIAQLNSLLFNASWEGNNQAIIELLTQGADINSQHTFGATPIYAAARNNNPMTVKLLRDKGADINIPINDGANPLYASSYHCHSYITKILLEAGADKEKESKKDNDDQGHTPLEAAVSSGCTKDVELLLKYGAATHSNNLQTPISLAKSMQNDSPQHSKIHEVVMDSYFAWLETALPNITKNLDIDSSKTFQVVVVRYNEDLSWIAKEFTNNEEIIIYNKGNDDLNYLPNNCQVIKTPNVGWFGGTILLHLASNYNNLADRTLFVQGEPYDQHVELPLIRHKGPLESKCNTIIAKCTQTSLQEMSDMLGGHPQKAWEESKYGHKFKLPDYSMIDYAHKFVSKNLSPEAPLFMTWGAQFAINKENVLSNSQEFYQNFLPEFNETYPIADFSQEKLWDEMFNKLNYKLFDAAWKGNDKAIVTLLSKGANINSQHLAGATSIYAAARNDRATTVQLLIDNGANLEIPISTGATPLYASAFNCNSNCTKILIEAGANQEITVDGYTPFWGGIYSGCTQDTLHFLENGANILSDNLHPPLYVAAKVQDEDSAHEETSKIIMDRYWKIVENYPSIDAKTTFEVVVVRYKEDLSWIAKEFKTEKVVIYNKGENNLNYLPDNCQIINIPNIGWLGGTYLAHIVNNYDKLPEKTLFLQGNPYDTDAFLPMSRYKGYLNSTCSNIVAKCTKSTLLHQSKYFESFNEKNWREGWEDGRYLCFDQPLDFNLIEFTHKYIDPNYSPEDVLDINFGAQFSVNADQIRLHPKEYYKIILSLFDKKCPREDFYLEKVWNIIFQLTKITELNDNLFNAAWKGDNQAIISLLNEGANINSQYSIGATGATPIYVAARNNQPETVQLLIDNGANLEMPLIIEPGVTPLYSAALNCYPDITKTLIDAGANLEAKHKDHSPLYVSIFSKCLPNVIHLLNANAELYSDAVSSHHIIMPLNFNSAMYNAENRTKLTEEIYPVVLEHYWKITEDEVQRIDQETQDSSTTFEVVVVRYKEDLSWIAKEFPNDKITIYNKGPNDIKELPTNCQIINIENVGYLGGTYLKHIIDNYSHLADRTLFMQGHPYDVNTFLPLIRHKKDLPSNCNNIIAKCFNTTLAEEWSFLQNLEWDSLPRYKDFTPRDANMLDFHYKYIGNHSLEETMYVTYGAIFAADKDVILRHEVEHYSRMLPEFDCIKPMADHYMEREWDNIFDI